MTQIAGFIQNIKAGDALPTDLEDAVLKSSMAENLRYFGSICGRECKALGFHHGAEEGHMFPELEDKAVDGIRAVVTRLREEHEVVHELINRLANAAQALGYETTQARFDEVDAIFAQLFQVIRSHFRYEETELAEAIGYYLDGI